MKLSGFARERLSPEVFARLQATVADFENEGRGENIRPLKNYEERNICTHLRTEFHGWADGGQKMCILASWKSSMNLLVRIVGNQSRCYWI